MVNLESHLFNECIILILVNITLVCFVSSKLFHKIRKATEVSAQVRQKIEMRTLWHVSVDPNDAFGSQISNVMLELFVVPLLLFSEQSCRYKAVFGGQS